MDISNNAGCLQQNDNKQLLTSKLFHLATIGWKLQHLGQMFTQLLFQFRSHQEDLCTFPNFSIKLEK